MKNNKSPSWSILTSVLATAVIVLALAIVHARDGAAETVSVIAPPFASCNLHCHDCGGSAHYTHYDAYNDYSGHEEATCHVGFTCAVHRCEPEEGGQTLSAEKALAALQSGSLGSVQQLASKYPKTVSINKTFNAVQIMSCNGKVIALIPLTDRGLGVPVN